MERPTLTTERLVLRAVSAADAAAIQRLAGDLEIARNTLLIPHPYPEGAAEAWIARIGESDDNHVFAVTADGDVAGVIGLHVERQHERGEIGYWIGVPYWNRGYASEAAAAVVAYAFRDLALNRLFAYHFLRNPASGRVLRKIGMRHEGTMRQHLVKWGERVDIDCYGMLREDWA